MYPTTRPGTTGLRGTRSTRVVAEREWAMRNWAYLWVVSALAVAAPARAADAPRPNVLLSLADDLGFSDLGCYGGEIATPNLDKLAANGLQFRQFYNCTRCCPTRASLLTGLYPHQAGVGGMNNDTGRPGYRG